MKNYSTFPDHAKAWVYQSSRLLSQEEVNYLKDELSKFTSSWESHGSHLKATYEIFYNTFVVLFVDEEGDSMCGRARDASVNLMKQLGGTLELDFLDRMIQSYKHDGEVKIIHLNDFRTLAAEHAIDENTIVFNNLVDTKADFDQKWEIPLKQSWHKQFFSN